eukprot:GEMP01050473.1.p2 GENE.GEMP01050473.1~~GEMP01050473.1.p2  ORF type:complete len:147 (+),score=40.80 GEMP01050473.1:1113-1553(+)
MENGVADDRWRYARKRQTQAAAAVDEDGRLHGVLDVVAARSLPRPEAGTVHFRPGAEAGTARSRPRPLPEPGTARSPGAAAGTARSPPLVGAAFEGRSRPHATARFAHAPDDKEKAAAPHHVADRGLLLADRLHLFGAAMIAEAAD